MPQKNVAYVIGYVQPPAKIEPLLAASIGNVRRSFEIEGLVNDRQEAIDQIRAWICDDLGLDREIGLPREKEFKAANRTGHYVSDNDTPSGEDYFIFLWKREIDRGYLWNGYTDELVRVWFVKPVYKTNDDSDSDTSDDSSDSSGSE